MAKSPRAASKAAAAPAPDERALSPEDEEAVLAKLDEWANSSVGDQAVLAMHSRVGTFLHRRMRRPSAVLDPMIVPYG